MGFTDFLKEIGNGVGKISGRIVESMASQGIETSQLTGKVLTLAILSGGIWIIAKFIKKPAKWIFIALLAFLAFTILLSLNS